MKITNLIWLPHIVQKIWQKHQVSQYEVEEVFQAKPRFRFVEKGHRPGENVYAALGRSDSGRYLTCFFVYKRNSQALIVTARNMSNAERKRYERK